MDPEISVLVLGLLGQARSEAWKVFSSAPHALDLDELTSLAYTGLTMAAVRWPVYCAERGFDPGCGQVPCADPSSCGTRFFAAYCLRRIRGAMLDAMRSQDYVTRSVRSRARQLREAGHDLGRSEAELAAATGLSRRQIRDTLSGVAARPVSFDAEVHDVPEFGGTESRVVVASILDAVAGALDGLDAETQVVIALRFHQGLDFAEIASKLGTDKDRVEHLHNAGVRAVHGVMLRAVTLGSATLAVSRSWILLNWPPPARSAPPAGPPWRRFPLI